MRTKGEVINTLKNIIKSNKKESFLTDRYIYHLFLKHAKLLIRRLDSTNKLMKFNPIFQTIDCLELIDVDKVQAKCIGIKTKLTIKRTKHKLPNIFEGYWGALIRSVSSIDGSIELQPTYATTYIDIVNQKNFKYNKTKYYWFSEGHLYIPNVEWDAVKVDGLFEDDISYLNGDCKNCISQQEQKMYIPEHLHTDIEKLVLQDLGITLSIPQDLADDKQTVTR